MAKKPKDDTLRGSHLTAAVAETVFGWRNVYNHDGELIGKKADKLGRFRIAKVPDYLGDPTQAYEIDERMKQLGKSAPYFKELARMTKANKIPFDWATPSSGREALKVLGGKQCGARRRPKK